MVEMGRLRDTVRGVPGSSARIIPIYPEFIYELCDTG